MSDVARYQVVVTFSSETTGGRPHRFRTDVWTTGFSGAYQWAEQALFDQLGPVTIHGHYAQKVPDGPRHPRHGEADHRPGALLDGDQCTLTVSSYNGPLLVQPLPVLLPMARYAGDSSGELLRWSYQPPRDPDDPGPALPREYARLLVQELPDCEVPR